ncbi:uncharacterized protein LOC118588653 [Onychomys torridus]|uniref:uncharacterized protein LOC118588653 n=1 Tax=Onychomys torridus TaxID=38674 RepID=UPI00167F242C|nr:uncharacterized protein LOC118588653 [Onychomys torridus]
MSPNRRHLSLSSRCDKHRQNGVRAVTPQPPQVDLAPPTPSQRACVAGPRARPRSPQGGGVCDVRDGGRLIHTAAARRGPHLQLHLQASGLLGVKSRADGPSCRHPWADSEIRVFLQEWEVVERITGHPGSRIYQKSWALYQRLRIGNHLPPENLQTSRNRPWDHGIPGPSAQLQGNLLPLMSQGDSPFLRRETQKHCYLSSVPYLLPASDSGTWEDMVNFLELETMLQFAEVQKSAPSLSLGSLLVFLCEGSV